MNIEYWFPENLFYEDRFDEYIKYDKPHIDLFGTDYGYWTKKREYTEIGEWFHNKPGIVYFLVGIIYYPISYMFWIVLNFFILPLIIWPLKFFIRKWE